jgi:mono/diheme cytochrome c family protein
MLTAIVAGASMSSRAQVPGDTTAAAPAAPAFAGAIWTGVYTEEQATRGEEVSNKLCTSCHGPDLSGGEAGPTLVGEEFMVTWKSLSLADFFDRVHATMPADAPKSMTPRQTSDVTAYVLKLNKYPAGQNELSTDLAALKSIVFEAAPTAK